MTKYVICDHADLGCGECMAAKPHREYECPVKFRECDVVGEIVECVAWKAHGGYAHLGQSRGQGNRNRERIWFSPACLRAKQRKLL